MINQFNQHRMRRIAGIVGTLCVLAALAGCSLVSDEDPEPTAGSTPIGWATPQPDTPTPTATPTDTATPEDTASPLPSVTAAPTLTPAGDQPPAGAPTATPLQQAMPTKPPLHTLTAAPTITNTPFTIITARPLVTVTNTPFVAASPAPSATETRVFAPPPTFTPVFIPQTPVSPTPPPPSALVCPTCGQLRMRDAPGTAGSVLSYLDANQPVTIIGRTADSAWAQIVLADGSSGWVATEYLVLNIDLSVVSVTGDAQSAPTAVAALPGADVGGSVISGVSFTARQIFLDGLAKGNRAHAFTRVGDSISAAPQFLTQIGQGNYSLGEYGHLGTAISFFSGPNAAGANPFAAGSIAAHNSWGADSVLNPALAPAGVCRPGEIPLVCEYRVAKPSVAIIMFGTNDSGGIPAETFRANLQRIVQTSIDMGVIPVLSTIPPKHYNPATDGRVIEFNQIIIATARGYDVPLIDYYTAMRSLPGEGLHPDGVHPSTPPDGITTIFDADHLKYGYTLRNLTALQMLYTLWQQVLYDADQAVPATSPPGAIDPGPGPGSGDAEYSCPGAPPVRLRVGMTARVTPGLPNKVRSQPAAGAAEVGSIPGEGIFSVTGGPTCADGYTWWQVNYQGLVGWTASGTAQEYWLEPWE